MSDPIVIHGTLLRGFLCCFNVIITYQVLLGSYQAPIIELTYSISIIQTLNHFYGDSLCKKKLVVSPLLIQYLIGNSLKALS